MSIIALYKYENSHSSITNNFFNRKIKKKKYERPRYVWINRN